MTSRASRLGRIADSEGIEPDELEDALRLLALDYPITMLEVLDIVEDVGLVGARARIEATLRGDA